MEWSFNKARVETFSDGIFAIIVTLLVLELKVPDIEYPNNAYALWDALKNILPKFIGWVISFLIVCVIWVNHHKLFDQIKQVNHTLFWLNANLLLWTSLIPFPTALVGDYIENPLALLIFGLVLSLMSLSFYIIRLAMLNNKATLKEGIDEAMFKLATKKSLLFGPVLYLSGAMLSLVNTWLSLIVYAFAPLYFIFWGTKQTKS